ncbi:3d6be202-cb23-4139-9b52-477ff5dd936b [Sclerotinia trifoliorum]|uniref:3d6be202-cb23-4139-9b52-477ff5dd936b n=1 Tax=Sclerotinia trifoliorum TaxID=28548 RepID=A0A8H2VMM0_9HELO|nr:3d6be202-cb23-4139-9b52-477ff5dd936b [Sclerotinia trifoliorum]
MLRSFTIDHNLDNSQLFCSVTDSLLKFNTVKMPPGRRSKKASQKSSLDTCVANLCRELNRNSETNGREKIDENTVESLCEALHSAKDKDTITVAAVRNLLSTLENQDGEFCCSLDIKTFCVVLNIILCSEGCREGERILVLLANELHQQFLPQDAEISESVLIDIARALDVGHLIEYFVDDSKPNGTRRWVGIIMQQLLRGPEAVSEQFQHTPEDIRRSIGPLILNEENEIHRLICGQVLAALLNADILPEEVWPVGTEKKDYEDFPTALENPSEWKSQFQLWVDDKWPDSPSQTPPHMLYYSHSVVTIPPFRLGKYGENIELVLEDGYVLFLKTSTEQELDQILQVPCNSISRISVSDSSTVINGKEVCDIVFEIKDDRKVSCYLNSRPTTFQQLCLTIGSGMKELMSDLQNECTETEFSRERIKCSQAEDDIRVQGEGSPPEAEIRDRLSSENEHQQTTTSGTLSFESDKLNTNVSFKGVTRPELVQSEAGDNISSNVVSKFEQFQQFPNGKNAASNTNLPENYDKASFRDSPTIPTHREILPTPGEAEEPNDEALETNDQALLSRQKGKARPRISLPLQINESLSDKNATNATEVVTIEEKLSASLPSRRKAPISDTQPSPVLAKHSPPNLEPSLNISKVPKKYSVKPKPPIPASKSKAESSGQTVPARITTVPKNKAGSNETREPVETSIYDFPENVEDDETTTKADRQSKKETKKRVGGSQPKGQQKGKASGKGRGKSAKTHQRPGPIPMEAGEPIFTKRGSQRAAANQAKLSMSKINDEMEDIEDDFSDQRDSGPAQPNVSRKRKMMEPSAEPAVAEANSTPLLEPALERNQEALVLQQQDAQALGLLDSNFQQEDPFEIGDLYTASPPASNDQQRYGQETPEPSRRTAAVNFANQLDGLLSDDAGGDDKTSLTNTSSKGLFKKRVPQIALPLKRETPEQSTSEKKSTVIEKVVPEAMIQGAKTYDSHQCQDEDSLGPQLQEGNSTMSEAPTNEKLVPFLSCETDVDKNQKAVRTDGAEGETDMKLLVGTAEQETEHVLITNNSDPVLAIPSHPLSRFPNSSKQEIVHKPMALKAIASSFNQPRLESSSPTLLADLTLIEEKKRKVVAEVTVPSKRRRPVATKNSEYPPISTSGPLAQTKTYPDISSSKSKALLDDRIIRKPNLIHFGVKGAQNQGSSSTSKPVIERDTEVSATISDTARDKSQGAVQNKRRYDDEEDEGSLFVSQSPPRKRQSSSPPAVIMPTIAPTSMETDSGPLVPVTLKASSQGSRVDAFGSPLAQHSMPSIGQILKVQQTAPAPEFGQLTSRTIDFHRDVPTITVPSPDSEVKDTPEIFGPQIKVVSIAKARPAPPGESPVRYVPHTKTQHGTYEGILTMENIQEEKVLPDPFVEDVHKKSSGFTERLRARQTNITSKADGGLNVRFSDPDKTLVEIEVQNSTRELSSPSESTSISSFRSEDSSNTPMQELSPNSQWSLAIQPHYKGYADTVHKIASEMVIRLANEEDASKLVVRQYNENASGMLEGLTSKRDVEKASIHQQIENKKEELIGMYSEARNVMTQTEKDIKAAPVGDLNRKWQERQEFILREMK